MLLIMRFYAVANRILRLPVLFYDKSIFLFLKNYFPAKRRLILYNRLIRQLLNCHK